MKYLPTTGSRKQLAKTMSIITTLGWFVTIICVLMGWVTKDQVDLIGVTFDRWYITLGMVMGIYALSENLAKHSHAVLNKND